MVRNIFTIFITIGLATCFAPSAPAQYVGGSIVVVPPDPGQGSDYFKGIPGDYVIDPSLKDQRRMGLLSPEEEDCATAKQALVAAISTRRVLWLSDEDVRDMSCTEAQTAASVWAGWKSRSTIELERRREADRQEWERAQAARSALAHANSQAMRELLGTSSESDPEPLGDKPQSTSPKPDAPAKRSKSEQNADAMKELLGSNPSDSSGSDLIGELIAQGEHSEFNHSSAYGTTAGAVGPAEHVYKNSLDARPPDGLQVESGYSLNDGFKALVYTGTFQGVDVVYVAFAGTEDTKDWVTNFGSFADLFAQSGDDNSYIPSQFKFALELAAQVQSLHPGQQIILTGHSLGGMLAAYASAKTGLPAVVFNSAGTEKMITKSKKGGRNQFGHVVHVNATGDMLTQDPIMAHFVGRPWSSDVRTVPSGSPGVHIDNHDLEPLADAVRRGTPITPSTGTPASSRPAWHLQYLDSRGAPR